jgi:hypothetical protein
MHATPLAGGGSFTQFMRGEDFKLKQCVQGLAAMLNVLGTELPSYIVCKR